MLRRSWRIGVWVLVLGLCAFGIYKMEHYQIERNVLGDGKAPDPAPVAKEIVDKLSDIDSYREVADRGRLTLYFEPITSSIAIRDRSTGALWMSAAQISDEALGGSELLKNSVRAPLNLTYADYSRPVHDPLITNSITLPPKIESEPVEGGIRVHYDFEKLGISFAIEYTIGDDRLEVYVPASSIREKTSNLLVSLEVLPNLGSGTDRDQGYMFYPDGSGAISYFKETHPAYKDRYSATVFGSEEVLKRTGQRTENAYLPVFGANKNGSGFVAYATEGEYETKINYSPSGYTVNLNRVSGEFFYRRFYDAAIRRGEFSQRVERNLMPVDHRLRYVFLSKDQSDYAGMAGAYRAYLLSSGKLQSRIAQGEQQIPAAVDLFMGIKEDSVLRKQFLNVTTFAQARTFLEEMKAEGVGAMSVVLRGWMKDGEGDYPDSDEAAGSLGGRSKLTALTRYAKDSGIDLFLNFNNVDAFGKNLGFRKNLDVMKSPSKLALEDYYGSWYLLNAERARQKFAGGQSKRLAGYGAAGIDFEEMGEIALADANEYHPLTREGTVDKWLEIMRDSREQNGKVAVRGGNAYVLGTADRLSDIPLGDTGYVYSDEAVPFFQMVVHGHIPYSGDIPMNTHYDAKELFLKWVEYGSMPYYELTYDSPEKFRYTFYSDDLFSSTFAQWSPVLVQQYKELNEQLGHTWGQEIAGHRVLSRDVYETAYADGTKVVVNYASVPYKGAGIEVPPRDYRVLR
ncbi:DUF5696 domain-containing protein [Cohnella sp. REN36]|uniref:DUF5696 domain-containing protein n=1 Tax=Cohnella sp. REN36 TaxID=2887347 RepID=UPI001D14648E|nr:DUF5696 domain-containing protein [Cohnella sp. REN36]MCC3376573.1 DUF5696 domain-containing protein [Cohnella sp. REN36]